MRAAHSLGISLIFLFISCEGSKNKPVMTRDTPELQANHWNLAVKKSLEILIQGGAHKGEFAVFDFDNTTVSRDIGEATLGQISLEGGVSPATLSRDLSPPFSLDGALVDPQKERTLHGLYEKILHMVKHRGGGHSSNSIAYAWAVKMMRGFTPARILEYTEKAFNHGSADAERWGAQAVQTVSGFPRPFFQPEIIDLMGLLRVNGFDVLIVSASNVWTVRYMVKNFLNPAMVKLHGPGATIPPGHVTGVSVLLRDTRTGTLNSDRFLVESNKAYADLNPAELAHFTLTAQIEYPLPAYSGKVANIIRAKGMKRPYLAGGDSPNDYPMLRYARHRLWITRLERPAYQEAACHIAAASRGE
ncbi:hypothetical protein KKF84_10050 [Myxococcota bacterium]|nr:hypothetical protein [Myxococcota bacterium]MBU1535653.1 hypothetical protein [Myxococcota bacterium]